MKFTLCAIGSWGDVAPFISLGRALLERGSDVVLAAPPEFDAAINQAGLDFRPIAPTCTPVVQAASATGGAPLRSLPLLLRATRILTEETLTELPAIADGSQALVATGIAYAAPHVAEALGIAYRAVTACPRWYPSGCHPPATDTAARRQKLINSASWWATEWVTDRVLDSTVNGWRRRQGLAPVTGLYDRMLGRPGERLLAADKELAPLAADVLGVRQVCAIGPFPPDELPEDAQDFLDSGKPPIYVGFGSMHEANPTRMLDIVFESAAALNVRAIVPAQWATAAGRSMPNGCLAVGRVSHRRLFPRVAVVVHHGGAGTTASAARAGIPQVVIPHVLDQFYWARRVRALGIGPEPPSRKRLSQATLTAALSDALAAPEMVERARALSARLEGRDGAAESAALLHDDLCPERATSLSKYNCSGATIERRVEDNAAPGV